MLRLYTDIKKLYTFKDDHKYLILIKDAALLVEGSSIVWVGKKSIAVKKFPKVKKTSLDVTTLLPGFIDCHTHTVFAGDRQDEFEQRNTGVTYQQIAQQGGGIKKTVEKTRKASSAQLLKLAEKRCQEFLSQGVTTVEIKSGYGLDLKSELKILKVINDIKSVRAVPTFLGLHALPKEYSTSEAYLTEVLSWLPKIAKLCRRADIFIEQGYFSPDQARKYFKAVTEMDFDILAHCEQLSQSNGIDAAIDFNALSVDHCVHANTKQIMSLAKSKTVAVLLPASDFYLKIPYPPARKILDAGGKVALATDFNPGSSPTQSFNFIGVLARLEMQMTQAEVLRAVTLSAAQALGLDSVLGSLELGKAADFVGFDCELEDLFYQVGYHPVKCVSKAGKLAFLKKS